MKTCCYLLGIMLLSGCGEGDVHTPENSRTPPVLSEEQPPPSPVSDDDGQPAEVDRDNPPAMITEDGWVQRQLQMDEQVRSLREYAAKADPDDPFAMTEAEIEAFSKLDNPVAY